MDLNKNMTLDEITELFLANLNKLDTASFNQVLKAMQTVNNNEAKRKSLGRHLPLGGGKKKPVYSKRYTRTKRSNTMKRRH